MQELLGVVRCDLYRYEGAVGLLAAVRTYLCEPGFRFTFWFRVATYLLARSGCPPLLWFARWRRHALEIKYGVSIPCGAAIGPGLFIGHIGGIVVNVSAVIGRNCNLSHDVTIGQSNRGSRRGCPKIGDSVFIGPGARILGGVVVGDNAAVGANAVVLDDVAEGEVVAGIPARRVSTRGSALYVEWTEPDTVRTER
jgi:serine O-acetyltransferase